MEKKQLEQLCVDTIRTLSIDGIQKANSGHPGMPMGMADAAFVLWTKFLKHNPQNPKWVNRDRFVLSGGHGSMLLYSLLHLTGYDLPLDQIKNFRQWESLTPGHPEYVHTPGVEATTGPLGQGVANGVGMAIAEAMLAKKFNDENSKVINHYTYALLGDGDLMEGISHEAASLAGHLKLGKLIYLYDDNHISIDGDTDLSFSDDTLKRFEAYNWHVQQVDGHDRDAIEKAIKKAQAVGNQPSLIACKTHIGFGSPNKQDTSGVHGSPLGPDEIKLTKEAYGWKWEEPFYIPEEVLIKFRKAVESGKSSEAEWQNSIDKFEKNNPEKAEELNLMISGKLQDGWEKSLPVFSVEDGYLATRAASGKILNAIAPVLPNLVGGSADLAPSNNTYLKNIPAFSSKNYSGRNFHFGVREHGMGSVMNGMALHSGLIPYGGTFLVFSDYMRPPIRLAAMMGLKVVYVFTHDSIGLGEDGPTHQPIEHLASLRVIPNITVIRPCDANETAEAWRYALEQNDGPVALALTRQGVPTLNRDKYAPATNLSKGAYILNENDCENPDVVVISNGSEVHIALEAADMLKENNITAQVVSMPSWELFDKQPDAYKEKVLPENVKSRISIEAASTQGWHKYLGDKGVAIGLDHFGASAPAGNLYKKYKLTADNIMEKALTLINN